MPQVAAARPIVWIQAGHEPPGEPGYLAQGGTGSGPFGSEVGFTTRVAAAVVRDLRAAGVDARQTPARVTPWGAGGAAFVSIHHDEPGGHAVVGSAIAGVGENYYHGEGSGNPSPVPYPDSARHRAATGVTPAVEAASRALAERLARRFGRIATAANGFRGRFAGVEPRDGNPRVERFYGYYRTRARSRILIECGAAGTDDAFLRRVGLIAATIASGIRDGIRADSRR